MCLCIGPDHDVYSICGGAGAELSEGLHGVGAATHHRVPVRLSGGPLLPVHLRDRGGRAVSLLRHRH